VTSHDDAHLADAAALLAAAFAGGPFETWVQPDLDRQRRALPTLFHGVLRRCAEVGGVEVVRDADGSLAAVCGWVPSRELVVGPRAVLSTGLWRLPLPSEFGPTSTLRLLRHEHVTDAALGSHAAADTAYVWALGVPPARQGDGLGRRAVDAGRAAIAAAGFARVVLKTETPSNVPFYRHLGFDLVTELPHAPGVPAWILARSAT
jgi:ribosomal protein S18 acetylase RimI-like enzyme